MYKKEKLSLVEWGFLLGCLVFYFMWAVKQPYTYAPDEEMRFMIPQFIYEHGTLPKGYDPTLISPNWGFSYAFYPCFLGALFSAFCMKLTSFFTQDFFSLLVAARMTSVFSGVLTVYFSMKISKIWIKKPYGMMLPMLVAMLPQFAFLSSYVNNDIVAIMGSAVILYSWSLGMEDWDVKNCLLLAVGVIIVALSYYNAYGWILCSIFLFVLSFIFRLGNNHGMDKMWKMAGFTALIVLGAISYFFIRNAVLYHGDFLGMRSLTESSEQYALDFLKPSMRNTPKNSHMTFLEMMTTTDYTGHSWLYMTYQSLIGVLGCMNVFIGDKIYKLYTAVFVVGIIGMPVSIFMDQSKKGNRKTGLFYTMLLIGFIIPILLSLYYSYSTDYQAQGRYCATMLIAMLFFITKGLAAFLEIVEDLAGSKTAGICFCLFCFVIIGITLKVYWFTYLPSLMLQG